MINRFDAVTVYKPLEPVHVAKIAQMMMERLNTRLQTKGITLVADTSIYALLINQGYSFQFGARPMKRLIADKIESLIAKAMLEDKITKGNKIKLTIDEKSKEFIIEKVS
jgi:ATP-dependent Clp protease ATP-binding subunit ClpB